MIKSALARSVGWFHERPAAPFLRGAFARLWLHRMPDAGAPRVVVIPDATIDLQWIDGTFRVAGPDKSPQVEALPAGAIIIGLRFHPAAAAAWLGVPGNEILEQRPALDEIWGVPARLLAGKVRHNRDLAQLSASVENAVAEYAPNRAIIDAPMRAAYELIRSGRPPGAPLVPWLGRAIGMSERTLRRRFDECFGYGPKTLDRILRYHRFLRLAADAGSAGTTAILALEAGYSDQAHLVRESRRLTHNTPAALRATGS